MLFLNGLIVVNEEPETLDNKHPPLEVIRTVDIELSKRERAIQAQLIAMFPLLNFAKIEPEFTSPYRQDLYRKIIHSVQLLLDRMREARVMMGNIKDDESSGASVSSSVMGAFSPLNPYRRFHNRVTKHRLYLLSTALQSKTPLPQDSLASTITSMRAVHHDALVLSTRLARQPGEFRKRLYIIFQVLSL